MKNYYEILEVNEKASKEVVEKAYKALVQKYHPDKFNGEAKKIVAERLRDINEAYKIISDDFLREQYDKERQKEQVDSNLKSSNKKRIKTKEEFVEEDDDEDEEEKKSFLEKRKNKKKNKNKIGTIDGLATLTKQLFSNVSNIKKEKPKFTKKGVLSFIAAVIIVFSVGLILWFIPFTNGFMRAFLALN